MAHFFTKEDEAVAQFVLS